MSDLIGIIVGLFLVVVGLSGMISAVIDRHRGRGA